MKNLLCDNIGSDRSCARRFSGLWCSPACQSRDRIGAHPVPLFTLRRQAYGGQAKRATLRPFISERIASCFSFLAFSVLAFSAASTIAFADPKEDHLQNEKARRVATDLLRSGSNAAAFAHLKQNSRAEAGPRGNELGAVQALIALAGNLFNQRQIILARTVTLQAVSEAESVLDPRSGVDPRRKAELHASLGTLFEIVMFDLRGAQRQYETAAALSPQDPHLQRRKFAVIEKQKLPGGGSR